jgi:endoglucanase
MAAAPVPLRFATLRRLHREQGSTLASASPSPWPPQANAGSCKQLNFICHCFHKPPRPTKHSMLFAEIPPVPPPAIIQSAAYDTRIRLNTIGFLPMGPKQATVAAPCKEFNVVRVSDKAIVFTSLAGASFKTATTDTNETVQVIDFTAFAIPGRYRVEMAGVGASAPFDIASGVWNEPFETATRAMYLWRCGSEVETIRNGVTYRHAACHQEDGWLDYAGGGHTKRSSPGGWHDAGDYNKYVVNAGVSIGLMLKAWEQFPDRVATDSLGIPESGNHVPDLLDEVRWEIEWLFTMQGEDGRVYHKVSALDFRFWGPPDKDDSPRYFAPWSTGATADFVAMMAETSRAWRTYDEKFANRCLAAAKKSWEFLQTHPDQIDADQSAFKTGAYNAKDTSHRLWAAAELWESTGETSFLREFETRAKGFSYTFTLFGPNWVDVEDLAFATYLSASRPKERNADIVTRLTESLFARAKEIVATSQNNGYRRPLGVEPLAWSWGCNGSVAGQTLLLHLADRLRPDPAYRATAQCALDHLFGRNFNGRSYVTGLGAFPPEHPHDRRGEPAWPGYLVGGSWPDGRRWEDKLANYKVNEIAINWNAALIYATAAFVEPQTSKQ